ncbi:hypothetical protein E3N88_13633 [Mikania micrantha]|uniref:Uncharacterized protein n=1 Tax=Mikania micrantha TaxID=192012 RepID=A0A5N6P174_9ASTR|nr:hypothetical protein E3N88_13633 [Mikania micrantha]
MVDTCLPTMRWLLAVSWVPWLLVPPVVISLPVYLFIDALTSSPDLFCQGRVFTPPPLGTLHDRVASVCGSIGWENLSSEEGAGLGGGVASSCRSSGDRQFEGVSAAAGLPTCCSVVAVSDQVTFRVSLPVVLFIAAVGIQCYISWRDKNFATLMTHVFVRFLQAASWRGNMANVAAMAEIVLIKCETCTILQSTNPPKFPSLNNTEIEAFEKFTKPNDEYDCVDKYSFKAAHV